MNVIVDSNGVPSFNVRVFLVETVYDIKMKILMSHGIPVTKQTLLCQGIPLQDHVMLRDDGILDERNPHLYLSISPDDNPNQNNNNQVLPQTEQSSNPVHGFFNNQDSPSSNPVHGFFNNQDLPPVGSKRNMNQVGQTEQCSTSNSVNPMKRIKTDPMNLRVFVQPFEDTKNILMEFHKSDNVADLRKELVKMEERGQLRLPQEEYYFKIKEVTLNETQSFLWNRVADYNIIKIISKPVKLRVFLKPFEDTRVIQMEVKKSDNVEELRKRLAHLQLPQEGYYFIVRELILIETRSFKWNLVAEGDTIGIISKLSSKIFSQV